MKEGSQISWGQMTDKNISMVKTENPMDHFLKIRSGCSPIASPFPLLMLFSISFRKHALPTNWYIYSIVPVY